MKGEIAERVYDGFPIMGESRTASARSQPAATLRRLRCCTSAMDGDLEIREDIGKPPRKLDSTSLGAATILYTVGLSVLGLAIIGIGIFAAFEQ